jgi:hypothetical protein
VDEDLRANKKVFERTQQQIAIFPQSEMPPNDKLQAIAFQFNKDVENVKNALNDGLTDMNTPDAQNRGFADFSKVSLAWNKLVARINPYIKGQQTDPDFQAATSGDYNYVRQKLRDDLQQFFANAIQQINSFKREMYAATNQTPRVQNLDSLEDILQQLGTGFYKNVRYGAEERTSLYIPRLPPDVQQGQPPAPQPAPPQQQQPPPAQPPAVVLLQYDPQQFPQEAAEGNVDAALLNQAVNPYVAEAQDTPQTTVARTQELDGINQRIAADINAFELQNGYIQNPMLDPVDIIGAFTDDTRDEIQQFYQHAGDDDVDQFLQELIAMLGDYRRGVGRYAQQGQPAPQQGQPAPAPQQGQQAPAPTPPRRGRPAQIANSQVVIEETITRLGLRPQLTGYAAKSKADKGRLAPLVQRVAQALDQQYGTAQKPITQDFVRKTLNQMVGFGRPSGKGFFADALTKFGADALKDATGLSPFEALKKGLSFAKDVVYSKGRGATTSRGRPLRLNNDFTGTSVVPNTLAELKNRLRVAKDGDYVGDSTGAIIPNLQNRGVLGSGRRMEGGFIQIPSELLKPDGSPDDDWEEVEGSDITGSYSYPKSLPQRAKELIAREGSRILREAINRFIQVATATPQAALDAASRTSAAARAALPPVLDALRRAKAAADAGASATRDLYQKEATQTVINYIFAHPEVLMYYFGTGIGAVAGVATGLVRTYLRRGMRGNGRCCFNAGMCRGTKAYRFNYGQKSANVRKESVRGRGGSAPPEMLGGGNGVNVNIKYSKLPKALQPTDEDLNPTPRPRSVSGGVRRRRMPKESYEGFQDQENDVYTHRGGIKEASPLVHSEMLQDKALGLLKGLPRRLGVEDPKFKDKK